MKNTIIWVVVVVLIVLGVLFLGKGKTLEAPVEEVNQEVNAPLSGTVGTETGVVKEFTINGTNFDFDLKTITVKKGDKVKITYNSTQGFHDFKIDEYGLATKQMQSPGTEVIEFVADKAGSFEYYCSVGSHRQMGMVGTLIVE